MSFFETCVYLRGVWPPNASLYASSTCVHLRLLAGPFGQGLSASHRKSTQVYASPGQTKSQVDPSLQLALTCVAVWPGLKAVRKCRRICFPLSVKSWNDVTIILSVLFLVSRFCTPPEVKFHVFGSSKHREEKSLSNIFFAIFIITLWRFYRATKKTSVIYFKCS